MNSRAVFLDRDGVLVIPEFRDGRSFAPKRIEDFRFYPDALNSVRSLKAAGYKVVVVTNQPDVGAGTVDRAIVEAMHDRLLRELPVDAVEVCFHTRSDDCGCRKPKPGMLLHAARRLSIDCRASFMVGDRASDVEAGRAAGCRTVFVDLGYRNEKPDRPDHVVSSLAEATNYILNMDEPSWAEGVAT